MEIIGNVHLDFIIKTIRLPGVAPIWNGYCLSETVQLQAATANRIHDGRIVHDLEFDVLLFSSDDEISVCCSTKRIAHYQ